MKTKIQLLFLILLCMCFSHAQDKRNCYAMEDLTNRMAEDSGLEKRMKAIEAFTQQKANAIHSNQSIQGSIITIPVVVHVLYTNNTNNISEAQIQSQMEVLNRDFRRTNPDANNKWPQAANAQIEFKLATLDPNGNPTNGITRKYVNTATWGVNNNMKRSSQGGVDPWEPSEYLNMWVVDNLSSGGNTILGYAQFPGGSPSTDGVVMGDQYFGTMGTAQAPFDGGRTTTHEVGHYLNLYHIWGDGPCGSDDNVNDTPESDAANYGCSSNHSSCGSLDMVENYMDYSDDSCMNLFTLGQKSRMRATLGQGGYRYSLALSEKAGGPTGCSTAVPTNISISSISSSSANVSWNEVIGTTYDIRYKEVSNYSWNTISSSTNFKTISGLSASTAYEVQVRSKCSNSNVSNYSSSKIFTTSVTPDGYCLSQGLNVNYEYIEKVVLNTINNISTGGNGYSNFTSISTDLEKNSAYTISITPKWTGSQYNEGYGVWIDFNQDDDFSDVGELVFSKSPSKASLVTGTINIPSDALSGTTRMRVILKYNATPTACESSFDYGEVEDYSVNIAVNNTDIEKPSKPADLIVTDTTTSSITLTWNASTDNVGVNYYNIYQDGNVVKTSPSTTTTITGLASDTTYAYQVSAVDAAENESLKSNVVNAKTEAVVVEPPTDDYCSSQGQNVDDEYIQKVEINTINNVSGGGNGYSDFTSISTDLEKNKSHTIKLTPQWTGSQYNEGYGVWIDFNQDGDFTDAGEQVLTKSPSKSTLVSGSFEVPSAAISGSTRMRVVMKYNATPTPCEANFAYGEVEDYLVNIVRSTVDTEKPSQPTNLSVSSITQNTVSLVWNASSDNVGVVAYKVYQDGTLSTTQSTTNVTILGLTAGTTYSFDISAVDLAGNESVKSNVVNVTTQEEVVEPTPVEYCTSQGENIDDEYIQKVSINNINNVSGDGNGYSDFTSLSTDLSQGVTYDINITPAWTGQKFKEAYRVWIDFNQDGDFSDAGELVLSKLASYDASVTSDINIPNTALIGVTRMRVSMKYNALPSACETFSYGEVEDYTVNIVNVTNRLISNDSVLDKSPNNLIALYPNPAQEFIKVKLSKSSDQLTYRIIGLDSRVIQSGHAVDHRIDVQSLKAGLYILILYDGHHMLKSKFIKQ